MGTILGAIAGFAVGWLIAALRTKFTYLGGDYGMFEGPGCLATLLVEAVFTGIGAAIGTAFVQ
jgi:hypothetical protein